MLARTTRHVNILRIHRRLITMGKSLSFVAAAQDNRIAQLQVFKTNPFIQIFAVTNQGKFIAGNRLFCTAS